MSIPSISPEFQKINKRINKPAPTFDHPVGGVYDHVSVRHLHGQMLSRSVRFLFLLMEWLFIRGLLSLVRDAVGAVASLGAFFRVSPTKLVRFTATQRRWMLGCYIVLGCRVGEDGKRGVGVREMLLDSGDPRCAAAPWLGEGGNSHAIASRDCLIPPSGGSKAGVSQTHAPCFHIACCAGFAPSMKEWDFEAFNAMDRASIFSTIRYPFHSKKITDWFLTWLIGRL